MTGASQPPTVAAPGASPPRQPLPPGACDVHSHVFGPFDRFAPSAPSVYALPEATPDVHAKIRTKLGFARGVLTQAAPYGFDPSALLNAIAGSAGALKAVAAADSTVSDTTLAAWKRDGIVGLRFVEARAPGGVRYPGSVGFDQFVVLAPRMREHGLHAQLWAGTDEYREWLPRLLLLGVPLVLDHMGKPDPARGVADPGFQLLLAALREARVWVKLSICRVSSAAPDYADVRPLHDALVEANPDRLLWGSDWPYVRLTPAPDAGHLLDVFDAWTGDAALRTRILVDNPARLYGFDAVARPV